MQQQQRLHEQTDVKKCSFLAAAILKRKQKSEKIVSN
jgi:hypothetical protein